MMPVKAYILVFAGLLVLTGITTAAAFVDLGAWNVAVALAVAVVKALLVALYFMHLRHSNRLTLVFVTAGVLWVGHMLAFTFSDYLTRGW
jgi:cytochrome c oxidase subunit 4